MKMSHKIALALAVVYVVWGSTYLAIRIAIETLPPFVMAGLRFLAAGAMLMAWTLARGTERPTALHWRSATIIGALMLLGGNGLVSWSETRVASGIAALVIACVPIMIVVLEALRPGGKWPGPWVLAGVATGFGGLALLVGPRAGAGAIDGWGAVALIVASLAWSIGSLYSRSAPLPRAPLLGTGMEMLMGGVLLLVAGFLLGEGSRLDVRAVSLRSIVALVYLIVFGALLAFSCYVWLLKVAPPTLAATYAFVNPIVAVLLGWAFAGEELNSRIFVAAAIVVGGVAMITLGRGKRADRKLGA